MTLAVVGSSGAVIVSTAAGSVAVRAPADGEQIGRNGHEGDRRPLSLRAMTGAMGGRLSPAAEVRSSVSAMQVTPSNVLQIRNALLAESQLLSDKVAVASSTIQVGEPGLDEVSKSAAPAFNNKINALLNQCQAYGNALAEAAGNLEQMAKGYGHTEQQISESFTKFQSDNPAPSSAPGSTSAPDSAMQSFARSLASPAPVHPSPTPGGLRSLSPGASGGNS